MTEPITPEVLSEKMTAWSQKQDANAALLATAQEQLSILAAQVADLKTKPDTSAEVQALTKKLGELTATMADFEVAAKRPGFGSSKTERQSFARFLLDSGVRGFIQARADGLHTQADGKVKAECVVDLDSVYDRQNVKDSRERRGPLSMIEQQAFYNGRYDESSGSLAHWQPRIIEPGIVRPPERPTSVLSVLGVQNSAASKRVFNRRTKRMALVTAAAAATSAAGGPHSFKCKGSFKSFLNATIYYTGTSSWPLIVRHVNGTEETGFTYTTLAAASSDAAEAAQDIFTIGVTGTLAADFAIGDLLILADPADTTKALHVLPTGVKEGEASPYGKIVTDYVERNAVTIPIVYECPAQVLDDEPEFERELNGDFETMAMRSVAYQVWQGSGSGAGNQAQILGIKNVSGIQTQNALGGDSRYDVILRAVNKVRREGFTGTLDVFLHPDAILAMKLEKDLDDNYLAPPDFEGVMFHEETLMDSDTDIGYVLASGAYEIFECAGTRFAMTDSHADNFTKRVLTMMLQSRILTQDKQPLGICKINFTP